MARKDITLFDDPFDSPIASPTLILNTIPGSALAERIFNDPAAWEALKEDEETQINNNRLPLDELDAEEEEMAWLEGEIKRFSMPFTPSMLNGVVGSALPDDDDTIPRSPTHPKIVKATSTEYHHQDLAIPKSVQQDRFRSSPKPGPITVFPAYVRDPPGGLDAPRQGFNGQFPGLDGDDMIHFLNSAEVGSQDHFSSHLHMRLSHVLSGASRQMIGAIPETSGVLSPPSSESSSSSSSSPGPGFHPSPVGHLNPQAPPASALHVPSSAATSIVSPFNVYSASATLSFLEWHGIQANTPLGSAGTQAISSAISAGIGPSRSATPPPSSPPQIALTRAVSPCRAPPSDLPEAINQEYSASPSGIEDEANSSFGSVNDEDSTSSTPLSRSPALRKRHLPEHLKRCGMAYEKPAKRKPSTPLTHPRNSPKPPPTIPLPDIPTAAPPRVPPKDKPTPSSTERCFTIRRLPTIPTNSAAPNCEFDIHGSSSPMVYTPPPQPPHTSTHIAHSHTLRSTPSHIATKPMFISSRRVDSPDSTWTNSSLTASPGPTRSSPCPAGPRQRSTPTPTRSARYVNSYSSLSMGTVSTESSCPAVVTVSRSVSAPRGVQRHVYSKSE
ncbi:hypothetical protein NP233_g3376 [Leucocoprinus birnbaumii]|uniref:Uncharacterized protein n=1 Tax=Leucocoprinus birnbaumii TaxID=56174 RepID=A0AAD5W338_9AGAR|nr:hypothetical protein NP233_g3376 [Leucocoprinus birnbaumii]